LSNVLLPPSVLKFCPSGGSWTEHSAWVSRFRRMARDFERYGRTAAAFIRLDALATLRPLNDQERAALAELQIEPVGSPNAWIGIEDEFPLAEQSEIDPRVGRAIAQDMSDRALEGIPAERRARLRTRAAWIADKFLRGRVKDHNLRCDHCGFDPSGLIDPKILRLRSILDVHHKCPLEEGVRYTTIADFELLCPTCHRIEHATINAAGRGLIASKPNRPITQTSARPFKEMAAE
jgi:5-methylcytosine-specific restriction enzyme A